MSDFRIKTMVLGMVGTCCYIVYHEKTREAVIIDPADAADYIAGQCRPLDVKPAAVLLTHGHFDHILAAPELKRECGIPVCAYEKEAGMLADPSLSLTEGFSRNPVTVKPDVLLETGRNLRWRDLHGKPSPRRGTPRVLPATMWRRRTCL